MSFTLNSIAVKSYFFLILILFLSSPRLIAGKLPLIWQTSTSSPIESMAAKELRRYLYLHTGHLAQISTAKQMPADNELIIVTSRPHEILKTLDAEPLAPLKDQAFQLKSVQQGERKLLIIAGGNDFGTLYGVYHLMESLGFQFHLHGDTVPDQQNDFKITELDEKYSPLFELRGILPFHDFPEGPDWWNTNDYKFYLAQMAKMKMNFIGLHCYPDVPWGPEPSVWMGLPEDVNHDGTVKFSYPASYHTTERLNGYGEDAGSTKRWWGYSSLATTNFTAGASQLFNADNYGATCLGDVLYRDLTPDTSNQLFNRVGKLFNDVFTYAKNLGIKTALGTETPLALPVALTEHIKAKGLDPEAPDTRRQVYEGMMKRISLAHPLDYYWAWTPESWLNPVPEDMVKKTIAEFTMASQAIDKIDANFQFATCGWALGPAQDPTLFDRTLSPSVPLSSITSWLGASRLDPGFAAVKQRPKWAIPWLEDDTAMLSPQLWVGRLRRDASDALAYGCTGLFGIHWRTQILAPNFQTLAAAGWNQDWTPDAEPEVPADLLTPKEGHSGGRTVNHPELTITNGPANPVYQSCRFALDHYQLKIPNGTYQVTLKFAEIHYQQANKRVFDLTLQSHKVASALDVYAEVGFAKPYDLVIDKVEVTEGVLNIEFDALIEFPFIAGIVIDGTTAALNQIVGEPFTRKINCGGGAVSDFEPDLAHAPKISAQLGVRDFPSESFYLQWCRKEFGAEVATEIATIFTKLDSGGPLKAFSFESAWPRNMPLNNVWINGPGGIQVNSKRWSEVKNDYQFVEKLEAIAPRVQGPACQQRFNYWLDTFKAMRATGKLACLRAELDQLIAQLETEKLAPATRQNIIKQAIATRIQLSRLWETMMTYQIQASSTPGEFGTIANLEQHNRKNLQFLSLHDQKLTTLLGSPLPDEIKLSNDYQGEPRLFVTSPRSVIEPNESLTVTATILAKTKPSKLILNWSPLGQNTYQQITLDHVSRGIYQTQLPPMSQDFEYHITAEFPTHPSQLHFPPTAPKINQTVIIVPPSI